MSLIETRTFTSGAEINEHFKAIRKRLWKATGIVDPFMMTVKQKAEREAQIERDRKAAEVLHRQQFLDAKALAEVEALRIAELAHPIVARKAGAIQGTPKSRLIEMCEKSGVDYFDIVGPSRREIFTEVRHRLVGAMYLELTRDGKEFSLHQMGKLFDRDHATIHNSLKRCGIKPNARPLKGRKTKEPASGIAGVHEIKQRFRARVPYQGECFAAGTYATKEEAQKAHGLMLESLKAKKPLSVWQVYRLMGIEK